MRKETGFFHASRRAKAIWVFPKIGWNTPQKWNPWKIMDLKTLLNMGYFFGGKIPLFSETSISTNQVEAVLSSRLPHRLAGQKTHLREKTGRNQQTQRCGKITLNDVAGFNQPIWKNRFVKLGIFPNFRGENNKKHIWNHHLVNDVGSFFRKTRANIIHIVHVKPLWEDFSKHNFSLTARDSIEVKSFAPADLVKGHDWNKLHDINPARFYSYPCFHQIILISNTYCKSSVCMVFAPSFAVCNWSSSPDLLRQGQLLQ